MARYVIHITNWLPPTLNELTRGSLKARMRLGRFDTQPRVSGAGDENGSCCVEREAAESHGLSNILIANPADLAMPPSRKQLY